MRPMRLHGIIVLSLAFLSTASLAQLSGTKYIGGQSPDYATIKDAIDALHSLGVSDSVQFLVRPGAYNEQLLIHSIPGASNTNTITFQGTSAAQCTVWYASTQYDTNWVLRIHGGRYLRFRNLTFQERGTQYSRVVLLTSGAADLEFSDNVFLGYINANGASEGHAIVYCQDQGASNISLKGNTFWYGGYAINVSGGGTNGHVQGIEVSNNTFYSNKYVAIHLHEADNCPVRGNTIVDATSYGIWGRMYGTSSITGNRIACGYRGIELDASTGSVSPGLLVANNSIAMTSGYGIYLNSGGSIRIVHNTVEMNAIDSGPTALLVTYATSVSVLNNILVCPNRGRPFVTNTYQGITAFDYNDLYTADNLLAWWSSANGDTVQAFDLAELQSGSGTNAHSISDHPLFLADSLLIPTCPWVNGTGTPLADVTADIAGNPRDPAHPDVGAFEFTPSPTIGPPLAGDYMVGAGGSYPDIGSAIKDVTLRGVSAPVSFSILSGSYPSHETIIHIPGSSKENPVTFQSASHDTGDVELTYAASGDDDNYILRILGGDNLLFKSLRFHPAGSTFAMGITVYGGSDSLAFLNNLFSGHYVTDAQYRTTLLYFHEAQARRCVINGNTLRSAGIAVYIDDQLVDIAGVVVTGNVFDHVGYNALSMRGVANLMVESNTVRPGVAYGFDLSYITGATKIEKNALSCNYGGFKLNNLSGSLSVPIAIVNNVIVLDNASTSDAAGIFLTNVHYAGVYHNSVSLGGTSVSSAAIRITNTSSHISLLNNIFAHKGLGTAYWTDFTFAGDPVDVSDFNDLYTAGNFLGYYGSGWFIDLNDLRSKTGREQHSLSIYPHFADDVDLHPASPWLDNKGTAGTGVTEDIEGHSRNLTTPDIGAYEFSSDPFKTPWSGIMTVGTGGDISDLRTAVEEVQLRGLGGSLTFLLLSGNHTGHVSLKSIPGATQEKTLTLTSQTGNPADAVISYPATGDTDNYVFQIYGGDFIHLERLTLQATGTSSYYTKVLDIVGGADSLWVTNNIFTGKANQTSTDDAALFASVNSFSRSRIVQSNSFQNGGFAIRQEGTASPYPRPMGTIIADNTTSTSGYAGIDLRYSLSPQVLRNTVDARAVGIKVQDCDSSLLVVGNKIVATAGTGIQVQSCAASGLHRALVANNFLTASSTSTAYGITTASSNYVDIAFNSVNNIGTPVTPGAAYRDNGSCTQLRLLSNILANTGGGYTLYVTTPADIAASDYNDLYATGTNIAYWSGNRATLADLQTASGMDAHSIAVDPAFTSSTDLHTLTPSLDGKATPVDGVTTDIDGQKRHPLTPDIGADEYRLGPNTAPQLVSPIPDASYPEDSGEHLVALLNSVFVDNDAGDVLTFTAAITAGDISLSLRSDSLFVNCLPDKDDTSTVTVLATDLDGLTAADTFLVRYTPVNDPPVARDDSAVTTVNTPVKVSVLRNDFDIEGSVVLIWSVGSVSHGTVAIDPGDTTLTYTPQTGYTGPDSCYYVITDGGGGFDTATVRISVLSVFSLVSTPFDSISHCSAAWGDYDADGDMDLAITGLRTAPDLRYSMIYRNVPGGFNVSSLYPGLQPNKDQGLTWIDLDGDGDLDLTMAGVQTGSATNRTILYRNDIVTMTQLTTDLPGIWGGALAWADYDNDGDPDLLITGSTDVGVHICRIYRNDGPGASNAWTFTDINAGLPPIWQSSAAWGDFDKDGDPDFVITGVNSSATVFSRIYRNDAGTFVDIGATLVPVFNGSAAWEDFDSDGDLDLLITGHTDSPDHVTLLYRNDNGTFTQVPTTMRGVSASSVAWGDYDGDGDPDVLIAGQDTTGAYLTRLYSNEAGQFGTVFHTFPGVTWGTVALVDFDRDGDLDPFIAGYTQDGKRVVTLYRNNLPVTNTAPEPPIVWGTSSIVTDWTLRWHPATDGETPPGGLTYNVRVGTEPGHSDVVAAMSLSDGTRMVPARGNADKDTLRILHNLRQGKLYHWSVQSVDPSFVGSPFYIEQRFSVWHPAFSEIYSGLPNRISGACAWGDYNRDGKLDVALAGSWPTLGVGNAAVYVRATGDFRAITASLQQVYYPAFAWGDYDNDGDLDLAIAGTTGTRSVTQIYRNGPTGLVDIAAGLSGTHDGALAWGDYDNDGDLDLLITGNWTTKLYRNTGGTFADAGATFVQQLKSSAEWGDYDRDGDLDLLLTGQSPSSGNPVMNSRIYRNDNGVFTDINAGLMEVRSGTGIWGDYDSDGDLDILIAGDMGTISPNVPFTGLYRNDGGTFTLVQTPFDSVHHACAAWADFDNDGRLDLVLCGDTVRFGQGGSITRIFRNTVSGFVAIDHPIIPMSDGTVAWGSVLDPGRLDLLLTGGGWTKLYWNRSQTSNTPPGVPTSLQAVYRDSLVLLRWMRPSDNETPRAALTYNIRIGTTRGGSQIMSAMSDSNGIRVIPARGNAGTDTVHVIKKLVPGKRYYWTVQAIDNGYRASPFATEQSFIFGFSVANVRRFGIFKPITDLQITSDTLTLALGMLGGAPSLNKATGEWMVKEVTVMIDSVLHTADGDLEFTLTHSGVTDTLIYRTGGSGDNFIATSLNDAASTPVASGVAPFTGEFLPFSPLSKFQGLDPVGDWVLKIYDALAGNSGTLQAWELSVGYDKATGTDKEEGIPTQFVVFPNYPNPFNPTTQIKFGLPQASEVSVVIYNLLGQKVAELLRERRNAGYHSVSFDGSGVASGMYIYRVTAGEHVGIGKMALVK